MSQFQITYKTTDLSCEIKLSGSIDNKFQFQDIDPKIKTILIHLDDVQYINSFGIKLWVQWLQKVRKEVVLILYGVRPALISSINSISGFVLPTTIVQSLYAPFISKNGEESIDVLLEFEKNYFSHKDLILPEVKDSHGENMTPDFIQKSFFKFLKL